MLKTVFYTPIGISGAALVGKDTLCNEIISIFEEKFDVKSKRHSIAGDFIKKDLKNMILKNLKLKIDPNLPKEKEMMRPLMVEYGRYMRKKTKGRYFIEKLNENRQFSKGYVPIITDIRYTEYPKDELYWLKTEKKGILIFLERKGIKDANEFEKKNNIILKNSADFHINVPNFKNISEYSIYMKDIILNIVESYTLPLTNRTSFGS